MDMTGERHIPAPRQKVWMALNDPQVLKASIPGCESLEKTGENQMKATASVRIGPISARFSGNVQLSDLDPPNGYKISGEGQGGVAGFAKGGAEVTLADDGEFTLLRYTVNAQVGGKIAQLGARLIDASAKQMADNFFDRFTAEVAGPSETGAEGPAGVIAAVTGSPPAATPAATYAAAQTPPRITAEPVAVAPLMLQPTLGSPIIAWIGGIIFVFIVVMICSAYLSKLLTDKGFRVLPKTVADTAALLHEQGYIADKGLATTVHLALAMRRPLLLEGEPGTGKTEIAKVLASGLDRRLVRLQCYDGLDLAAAAYEWDHAKQLMAIRLAEAAGEADRDRLAADIYTRPFLRARPLLDAVDPDRPPAVLLIDELDRADEPFEAFLLELLADMQITVPEYGTIRAGVPPVIVLTSNRTREVHDAIRRRCLYQWVDYPDATRERAILRAKAPEIPARLTEQVVGFVQRLRGEDLFKLPGVAELIDWASALHHLDIHELDPEAVDDTLGILLKYQDDIAKIRGEEAARLVAEARQAAAA